MAFHYHASILIISTMFFWFLLVNSIQANINHEPKHFSQQIRFYPQQRLTRGIERLKYHNLDLGTARGYGKRAVNDEYVHHHHSNNNNLLMEWIALETRMRNMGMPKNLQRHQNSIPE